MKKKEQLLINFGYYAVVIMMAILVTYIAFTWLLPICISMIVTMALQPLIANIVKALHIKNKYAFVVVSIIVYIVIIGLLLYLCFIGMIQVYQLLEKLPTYLEAVFVFVKNNTDMEIINDISSYFYESINEIVQSGSITLINYIITIIKKVPTLLFDLMFIVISSLFFILDYSNIRSLILKHAPKEMYVLNVVNCIKDTISSLFKAYISIFIITFIELLVGFYIIGLNDALMLAFSIALFDFFPILGLDMIFIPWIVMLAFQNKMVLALHLLIMYMVMVISKNIFEPKLISKHIGMHPLITIISMFIGVTFLGIIGMIFVPLLIMIIKRVYELRREVEHV